MKHSWLAVLLFAIAFLAGCATAPPVDWNSRVGHYTYAQAVHELGPPNRQSRLSNGFAEFKWFLQPNNGAGFGASMNNNGFGPGQNISPVFNNQYLQLTFDTNGVLSAWSRNY